MNTEIPRCKCGAAVQWSFCFDMFYDRETGDYHPIQHHGPKECDLTDQHVCFVSYNEHKCKKCGAPLIKDCCCGAHKDLQPQFAGVQWDEDPNMVDD